MPNLNLRINRLKAMLGLEEKRVVLQGQLDALHQQLSALKDHLFDDAPSAPIKAAKKSSTLVKTSRKGRSQRGALKEQILSALSSAGSAGVRVTELAAALGTKAANIHAWFHSTGKRVPGIAKVSGGHYKLKGSAETAPAARATPAAKLTPVKAKSAKKKGKGSKRGELSSNIISALEAAGAKGLTIKELSEKIGAKYRNISVWFVTTGKNFPRVKKVGPGHYKVVA